MSLKVTVRPGDPSSKLTLSKREEGIIIRVLGVPEFELDLDLSGTVNEVEVVSHEGPLNGCESSSRRDPGFLRAKYEGLESAVISSKNEPACFPSKDCDVGDTKSDSRTHSFEQVIEDMNQPARIVTHEPQVVGVSYPTGQPISTSYEYNHVPETTHAPTTSVSGNPLVFSENRPNLAQLRHFFCKFSDLVLETIDAVASDQGKQVVNAPSPTPHFETRSEPGTPKILGGSKPKDDAASMPTDIVSSTRSVPTVSGYNPSEYQDEQHENDIRTAEAVPDDDVSIPHPITEHALPVYQTGDSNVIELTPTPIHLTGIVESETVCSLQECTTDGQPPVPEPQEPSDAIKQTRTEFQSDFSLPETQCYARFHAKATEGQTWDGYCTEYMQNISAMDICNNVSQEELRVDYYRRLALGQCPPQDQSDPVQGQSDPVPVQSQSGSIQGIESLWSTFPSPSINRGKKGKKKRK